ncbi:MAG TPA: hypothetical protein DDY40_11795 [Barnesiella intestinihominis]|nr:hypothetical protein [Barnesiella intestinihominis]HBX16943.1 hypothetical protein [Barnesiella sp.]
MINKRWTRLNSTARIFQPLRPLDIYPIAHTCAEEGGTFLISLQSNEVFIQQDTPLCFATQNIGERPKKQ